jgi:hypothetical protein
MNRLLSWLTILTSAAFLAACGGGGGGDSSNTAAVPANTGNVAPIVAPPTCNDPPPTSSTSVTVQGVIRYERVGSLPGGALDYSNITPQPVRGATVELLSGGCVVVATTQSSSTGQYAFTSVPGSVTLSIRVRAEMRQTVGSARWDTSVSDNTNGNAMYALFSTNFNSGTGHTQDVLAGSGWGGSSYTSTRAAGPFAILDVFYQSQQKVLAANSSTVFPPLRAFWSINNSNASGNLVLGNIGSSFFREITSNGQVVRELYILGRQDSDTDEYDGSVVAHEWGHYFQSAFSRDDSTGGPHGSGDDRLDRRIAFSEGWGNAWSGIVLSSNTYRDSKGLQQSSGFSIPLNSGYASGGPKGWFREFSIQYILWDLNRQAGFDPIYSALTSNAFKSGVALSDIHAFSSAYRSVASTSATSALNSLLAAESISNNSDALGSNETNNGGSSATLPYYRSITILGSPATLASGQSLCVTGAFDQGNAFNKLGRYVYATFSTPTGGNKTITVSTATGGVDTDFEIHSGGRLVGLAELGTTGSESATVNLNAGTHVLLIYDFNNVRTSDPCFTVSIQ